MVNKITRTVVAYDFEVKFENGEKMVVTTTYDSPAKVASTMANNREMKVTSVTFIEAKDVKCSMSLELFYEMSDKKGV